MKWSIRHRYENGWINIGSGMYGYTMTEGEKDTVGTEIVLHLREDTENEKYSEYLDTWRIKSLVKKYSVALYVTKALVFASNYRNKLLF